MDNILIVTEYGIEAKCAELRETRGRVAYAAPGGVLAIVSAAAGTLRKASGAIEAWAKRPRAVGGDIGIRRSAIPPQ